jgi:hypothetical protein
MLGFHDTALDDVLAKEDRFKKISLRDAQGGATRDEKEQQARKEDKKKQKDLEKNNLPKAIQQLNQFVLQIHCSCYLISCNSDWVRIHSVSAASWYYQLRKCQVLC